MTIRQPDNLAFIKYDATGWVQVDWSYLYGTPGDTLQGFKIWYSATSRTPVWTVPPAFDNAKYGGDSGTTTQLFRIMIRLIDGLIMLGENFETYTAGPITGASMSSNTGYIWDGPWHDADVTVASPDFSTFFVALEDFESYPVGAITGASMTGDSSHWVGAWSEILSIFPTSLEDFESYPVGVITGASMTSNSSDWGGAWSEVALP